MQHIVHCFLHRNGLLGLNCASKNSAAKRFRSRLDGGSGKKHASNLIFKGNKQKAPERPQQPEQTPACTAQLESCILPHNQLS
jgi:hypothetical protein